MAAKLTRRSALGLLGGAALTGTLGFSNVARAGLRPGAGRINHSACKWCYPDLTVEELAVRGKAFRLQSIDLLGPNDWNAALKNGVTCAMAEGPSTIAEGFNKRANHEWLVPQFKERLQQVADAGLPNLIVFSGNRNGMDDEEGLQNCAIGLKQILPTAEKLGVTLCMELLNSKINHPDYMCDHTAWGVKLARQLGSERFKLLYDIYHMQIMEGDIIRTIKENHEYIGHYHTGGNPGRNEIDETQELYYPAIMRAIADTGFTGYVAQEFVPTRDPLTSLQQAIQICTV